MSYTKQQIEEEMEHGNDLLSTGPDDGDFDYGRKRYEHYQPQAHIHDWQPTEGGGYICECGEFITPEDAKSGHDEMRADEAREERREREDENS